MLLLPVLLVPGLYGSFYAITREVLPDLFDDANA